MQDLILLSLDWAFRITFALAVMFGLAVLFRNNKYLYWLFVRLASLLLLAFLILLVVLVATGLVYLAFGV